MHRSAAVRLRGEQQLVEVEIRRSTRAGERVSCIAAEDVERVCVVGCVDSYGGDLKKLQSARNTDCDLAAIGNEHFVGARPGQGHGEGVGRHEAREGGAQCAAHKTNAVSLDHNLGALKDGVRTKRYALETRPSKSCSAYAFLPLPPTLSSLPTLRSPPSP